MEARYIEFFFLIFFIEYFKLKEFEKMAEAGRSL